ncbi:MAG: hypothetical protein OEQ18_11380 [Gammaproteobacteria bacterium]|nr:hypothetical protein [Gammaproteobacteria bacterium]
MPVRLRPRAPTIEKRTQQNGKHVYRARVRRYGVPDRTKTFSRKSDAQAWARHIESSLDKASYLPSPEAAKLTVADLIDRYLKETLPTKPRNKTKDKTAALLKWWRAEVGTYSLPNPTPAVFVEARGKLERGRTRNGQRSPATVNRYLAAISHVFRTAVKEWHVLDQSPIDRVSRKSEPKGRERFLIDDERSRLLKACKASSCTPSVEVGQNSLIA